jgi:8-amino-7-oxononanoate synthase
MPWQQSLTHSHQRRRDENRWRERRTVASAQGRMLQVDGHSLLNFSSNDYLGLADHDAVKQAAIEATHQYGTGSGASHLVCGHQTPHHELELKLARFVGAESALVFSTGYMANLAVPQTFLGRNDLLLEDRLNHASLLDAGALATTKMKRYSHRDAEEVKQRLAESDVTRKLVMTDGVFSMDGDVAPVRKLAAVCERADAMLLVDDAHGFGVLGPTGAGLLQQEGVAVSGNVLMIGTLGKAAGSFGAFIAGDAVYIQHMIQFARPYIYTTALPPAVAAASLQAIKILESEPERRARLRLIIEQFRDRAAQSRLRVMESQTAIQPIVLGTDAAALAADRLLKNNGILAIAIRPPTVPEGSARLRLTLRADHTDADLDQLFEVLASDAFHEILDNDQGAA